jgi:hypothetical protein
MHKPGDGRPPRRREMSFTSATSRPATCAAASWPRSSVMAYPTDQPDPNRLSDQSANPNQATSSTTDLGGPRRSLVRMMDPQARWELPLLAGHLYV